MVCLSKLSNQKMLIYNISNSKPIIIMGWLLTITERLLTYHYTISEQFLMLNVCFPSISSHFTISFASFKCFFCSIRQRLFQTQPKVSKEYNENCNAFSLKLLHLSGHCDSCHKHSRYPPEVVFSCEKMMALC